MGSHPSAGPAEPMGSDATRASPPSSSIEHQVLQPASLQPQSPKFQLRQQHCGDDVRHQQEGGPAVPHSSLL